MVKEAIQEISLYQLDTNTYWCDSNTNGKQDADEIFRTSQSQNLEQAFAKFVNARPYNFWDFVEYRPKVLSGEWQDYFRHPVKNQIQSQLTNDITKLETLVLNNPVYRELLIDLRLIQEELPGIKFRYPEPGEIPGENASSFIGVYDPLQHEMIVKPGAPIALLIHELDHALTTKRRIDPWSKDFKVLCEQGHQHSIPKHPKLPGSHQTKVQFSFSLDFPIQGATKFQYNDVDNYDLLFKMLEHGKEICLEPKHQAASLANEVRAYITMARYLLFRIGFTQQQIEAIANIVNYSDEYIDAQKQNLEKGLQTHLAGSNLNYRWAYALVMSYLGRGGDNETQTLDQFVLDYYNNNKAPGFVSSPDCHQL